MSDRRSHPFKHRAKLFVNGTVHLVDRSIGFAGEWVMFCGQKFTLDANWTSLYETKLAVNCMGCIVEEEGVSIDVHRAP